MMVTQGRAPFQNIEKNADFFGLSTDEKPMDVPNGSTFYEMDGPKVYMYDAENRRWIEQ